MLVTTFEVLIDNREVCAYDFNGIRSDSRHGYQEIAVRVRRVMLGTGDYSIAGHESCGVAIERKSKEDAYYTIIRGRDRFTRELERLTQFWHAFVVIEATLLDLASPPPFSMVKPRSIFGSIQAWQLQYPSIAWIFADNRRAAELYTYRLLEKYARSRTQEGSIYARRNELDDDNLPARQHDTAATSGNLDRWQSEAITS